jgi:RHS repeat-associated protein
VVTGTTPSISYCYSDVPATLGGTCPSSPPYQIIETRAITSSLNEISTAVVDGLGRLSQTQLNSDPDGVDYVDTTYDQNGRKSTVSNPHRSGSSTTDGTTTYIYDALNRVKKVVEQDGSTVTTTYDQTNTANAGVCSTVTDEVGNSRQSCVDGLGRLTGVFEAPSSLNYETDYSYDALNDLLSVTQKGPPGTSSSLWRTRTFGYDSLSRLTSASNPESGGILYSYDADGNLINKTSPAPNQTSGSGTVTINYAYDSLNRLTQKSFSGAALQYAYDGNSLSGCGQAPPAITSPTNLIGRRSSMCSGMSASSWSYDAMGRPLLESRTNLKPYLPSKCTGSGKYRICTAPQPADATTLNVGYAYNLDGSLSTLTYPSGDVVTYTVGGAGRTTQVTDPSNNFVTSATYTPNGALAGMVNGYTSAFAGIVTSNAYNDRLQPILLSASVGTSSIFSLCYDFHLGVAINTPPCSIAAYSPPADNGNVGQVLNNVDSTRSVAYTYDSLNRIKQASTVNTTSSNCWGDAFTIDAWGNMWQINPTPNLPGSCSTQSLSDPPNALNQLTGLTYDIAGNVINDGAGNQPTYDAESTMATDAGVTYDYDADGGRTEKSSGTMYWPGPSGNLAETDLYGTINEEYIYFNGERIARVDRPSGTVHYYFSNHLGSASVITDAVGNVDEQTDYYPYGGIAYSSGSDPNHYKFTGKERDSESGLDNFEARYYESSLGRFMSPDRMGGFQGDPQGLNRYAYVRNGPLRLTDPSGMNFGIPCKGEGDSCHNGLQGAWIWSSDQGTFVFVPVSIGNGQNGQLQDVSANNTGSYTASFNGQNVSVTNSSPTPFSPQGTTVNAVWLQGTAPVGGIKGDGDLSDRFSFTFFDHGAGQTLDFEWQFNGTRGLAESILERAGFEYWWVGRDIGYDEYRLPTQERDSTHFLVSESPNITIPSARGSGHAGEYYPGFEHFWHDILGQ